MLNNNQLKADNMRQTKIEIIKIKFKLVSRVAEDLGDIYFFI